MMLRHPGLGAEVIKHDHQRCGVALRHGLLEHCRHTSAKGIHHHLRRCHATQARPLGIQAMQADALKAPSVGPGRGQGLQRLQGLGLIDPQPHLPGLLIRQRSRQTPAHRRIAVVVHHAAQNVPAQTLTMLMPDR